MAAVFDGDAEGFAFLAAHLGGGGFGGFVGDFVAAHRGEADRGEDVDLVDVPAELGFPVNGFEDAAGGGGGDDVVADAFDFHLRTGEAGEVAAGVEFDSLGHGVGMRLILWRFAVRLQAWRI